MMLDYADEGTNNNNKALEYKDAVEVRERPWKT